MEKNVYKTVRLKKDIALQHQTDQLAFCTGFCMQSVAVIGNWIALYMSREQDQKGEDEKQFSFLHLASDGNPSSFLEL